MYTQGLLLIHTAELSERTNFLHYSKRANEVKSNLRFDLTTHSPTCLKFSFTLNVHLNSASFASASALYMCSTFFSFYICHFFFGRAARKLNTFCYIWANSLAYMVCSNVFSQWIKDVWSSSKFTHTVGFILVHFACNIQTRRTGMSNLSLLAVRPRALSSKMVALVRFHWCPHIGLDLSVWLAPK